MSKKAEASEEHLKSFDSQFDDEDVLYVFRKHPVVMRKSLIVGMLCLLLGVVPSLFKAELSVFFIGLAIGAIVGLILFAPAWISWYYSVFIVTTQRLVQVTQKGLFHRSVVDMGLNQIQMVNYQIAGIEETLFGFGTIMMQTFVGDLVIHDVNHPAKTQKRILEILREQGIVTQNHPLQEEETNQELVPEEDEA
jgi:hypothetical protein